MSIRNKIILGVVLIFSTFFFVFVRWVAREVKPRYLEAIEDPLVDTAHILSSYLSAEATSETIDSSGLESILKDALKRKFSARIYLFSKEQVDLQVYVTNEKGIVIFDSEGNQTLGQDFSKWNDVRLSLQGKYGARSTKRIKDDASSGSLYVSAPVYRGDNIIGVVSVVKPVNRPLLFISVFRTKLIFYAAITLLLILGISSVMASKVVSPLRDLTQYAKDIKLGKTPRLVEKATGEIGELQTAFEEMRITLEGKEFIERYVQTLTHELKSPLAAIRGAAELLKEDIPVLKRDRFLSNILGESERLQQMVEKMLALVVVERKEELIDPKPFDLCGMLGEISESLTAAGSSRGVKVSFKDLKEAKILGDPFLVRQAIVNLVQNAIDFSDANSTVVLVAERKNDDYLIKIIDDGCGVPTFASEKIFDRFYSLARPSSGRKSTGLGLPFVKEVAALHKGSISIESRPEGGTEAVLKIRAKV